MPSAASNPTGRALDRLDQIDEYERLDDALVAVLGNELKVHARVCAGERQVLPPWA